MSHKFALSAITCAVTLSLFSQSVVAQETEDKDVEVIVVSGTPAGAGVSKKDASFAITNVDASSIEKLAPKSTADLFKAVPGVWAESSGGESGANVFVRGFPGGGDAPFLTVSLEGSPVYPAPTLSFLENSTLFRLDETIETMEALRGGPNPVVSNGQPGLTTNFRLKRGSGDTEALAKYSTSDYGLQRADLVLSGELSDDFYYMIGGYVKRSPGIRDAGFNSEQGQQFTINLTKEFDDGEINLYTRRTDDHGTWYLPTPLNVEGVDASYTQIGTNNRQATIHFGPDNESQAVDFAEGRGWDGHVSGGSIKLNLDNGLTIVDRFSLTQGKANTFGLVPNGSATTIGQVLADKYDAEQENAPTADYLNNLSIVGAVTGEVYADGTPVQQIGRWVVLKDIEAFTNDLAITKKWDKLTTSVGLYTANTKADDWWSLGNQSYHVLEAGGENLAVNYIDEMAPEAEDRQSKIECNLALEGCGWNYDINSTGDATTQALYTAINYKLNEDLTLDLGLRRENHQVEYTVDEGLDGKITKSVSFDESKTSWTTGANYSINETMAVFGRVNKGYKMPYFDDFRDNYDAYTLGTDLIKEVSQYELGYKYMTEDLQAYVTLFANDVNDTFVRVPGDPAEVLTNEAMGVEFDVNYYTERGLNISFNATVQDTEITKSAIVENQGNEAQRQPGWQMRITPSYDFELANDAYLTVYGTLSAVDDRYGDNENTVVLPGYEKLDLGVIYEPNEKLKVQLSVDNVTDEEAITEGDPRNPSAPNGRYIMPTSVKLSVSYQLF